MRGPEPSERGEPRVHFPQLLGFEPVEPALRIHRCFDEAGFAQNTQVLRHSWLGHAELTLDLPNRPVRRDEQAQDGAPIRLGDDFEH